MSDSYAKLRSADEAVVDQPAQFDFDHGCGLLLTGIAARIELDKDLLAQMAFRPQLAAPMRRMADDLFMPPSTRR